MAAIGARGGEGAARGHVDVDDVPLRLLLLHDAADLGDDVEHVEYVREDCDGLDTEGSEPLVHLPPVVAHLVYLVQLGPRHREGEEVHLVGPEAAFYLEGPDGAVYLLLQGDDVHRLYASPYRRVSGYLKAHR